MEWLLEDPSDIVVYGLMVREFGSAADSSSYGGKVRRSRIGMKTTCGAVVLCGACHVFEDVPLSAEHFVRRLVDAGGTSKQRD